MRSEEATLDPTTAARLELETETGSDADKVLQRLYAVLLPPSPPSSFSANFSPSRDQMRFLVQTSQRASGGTRPTMSSSIRLQRAT